MSKHTPGPWTIRSRSGADYGTTVYDVPEVCTNISNEQNARLIAGAPCVLEALKNIVNLWDHHASAHGDGTIFPLHEAARAAIAKAEGQQ